MAYELCVTCRALNAQAQDGIRLLTAVPPLFPKACGLAERQHGTAKSIAPRTVIVEMGQPVRGAAF